MQIAPAFWLCKPVAIKLGYDSMGNVFLQDLIREVRRHGAWALGFARSQVKSLNDAWQARGLNPKLSLAAGAICLALGGTAAAGLSGWHAASVRANQEAAQIAEMQRRIASVEADLAATRGRLALAETPRPVVASVVPPDLVKKIARLQASLKDVSKERRLAKAEYEAAAAALAKSAREREALATIKARLERKLIALKQDRPDASAHEADASSAPATAETASSAQPEAFDLRRFLNKLGVRASAEGGPFVPASSLRQHGADPQAMKILRSLPLSAPLAHYVVASPFGVRADPINEHEAFHTGLDFDAPYRSPVYNTAPGVVVFAGWAGAYGRMVEIDHGHGIHTRYCHLNRITVAMGQKLKRRVRIGLLGSTGRSTGPHVHYEVRVDGVPQDPEKFLRAGRSVVLVNEGQ